MMVAKADPVFLNNRLLIHPVESLHKEEKDLIKAVTLQDVRAVVHHQATHPHQIPVIVAAVLVQVGQVQAGPALAVPVLVQEMAAEGADKNEITQTNNQRGEHGKRI